MLRHIRIVLVASALCCFTGGCSKSSTPSREDSSGGKKETDRSQPGSPFDAEASEFVDKLKEAFDSWVREETVDQFRKTHPGIQVFEPTWSIGFVAGDRLIQYQVVSARPLGKELAPAVKRGYELVVSLDIQEGKILKDGKKITKRNKYIVQENKDSTWLIVIQGNADPASTK
jgi:hypothetical protein